MIGRYVYFAQPTNGGPIKVGVTGGLKERMSMLSAWVPGGVEVIATINGDAYREAYLKAALRPFCIQGEWMRSCVEVWRLIDEASESGNIRWLPAEHAEPNGRKLYSAIIADFGNISRLSRHLGRQIQSLKPLVMISNGLVGSLWLSIALASGVLPKWISERHDAALADKWPKGGAIDALFASLQAAPFSVAA